MPSSTEPASIPLWWAFVLFCATSALLFSNDSDPDLWGRVVYGLDRVTTGQVPATATRTYTAPDFPFVNHEFLSELVITYAYLAGGGVGIMMLKFLLVASVVALIVWTLCKRRTHALIAVVTILLMSVAVAPSLAIRPQMFSLLFFVIQLSILEFGTRDHFPTWLYAGIPVMMLIWACTHGGFLAGLAVLTVFAGMEVLQDWYVSKKFQWRLWAAWALVGFSCLLAIMFNPFGIELIFWFLEALRFPRPEITEWWPVETGDFSLWVWLGLLIMAGFAYLKEPPKRWAWPVLFLLLAWQSFEHKRHLMFLGIGFVYWVTPSLDAWYRKYKASTPEENDPFQKPIFQQLAYMLSLALVVGSIVSVALKMRGIPVSSQEYPIAAARFMDKHGLVGRTIVHFNSAQFLMAALGPDMKVAIDGRFRACYPQAMLDRYFDFQFAHQPQFPRHRDPKSPPQDKLALLDYKDPQYILWPTRDVAINQMIQKTGQWKKVYQDPGATLWARNSVALPDSLKNAIPVMKDRLEKPWEWWPGLPDPDATIQAGKH